MRRRLFEFWTAFVAERALLVVLLSLLAALLSLRYTARNLGITTDTTDMIAEELPFRQDYIRYQEMFPQLTKGAFVVVEADTPEFATEAAKELLARLDRDQRYIIDAYMPGGGAFLEEKGLLFLSLEDLDDLTNDLARAQPFLSRLYQDRSLRGLISMLSSAIEELDSSADLDLASFFRRINHTVESVLSGNPAWLSWQDIMNDEDSDSEDRRKTVIARIERDYAKLLPAAAPLQRIRDLAQGLDPEGNRGIRVRLTGGAAMGHEEMESLIEGSTFAGVLSLVLVTLSLSIGLRSWQTVIATVITLITGVILTAGFAALAVGHLNLISVAFAVLYIGLGVDYAIHFCLRFRALLIDGSDKRDAIRKSIGDVGPALGLCSISTAIGFFAFVPTAYAGVSELGVISGTGMFIGFAITLSLLPALLHVLPEPSFDRPVHLHGGEPLNSDWRSFPFRYRSVIRWLTALIVAASLILILHVTFEYDPIKLRDPSTESVAVINDIVATSGKHPSSIIVLAQSEAEAEVLEAGLEKLSTVDKVVSIHDFVPDEQEEKLFLIDELSLIMAADLLEPQQEPAPTLWEQVGQINAYLEKGKQFPEISAQAEISRQAALFRQLLSRLAAMTADDAITFLGGLEKRLLATLPMSLDLLRKSMSATEFTRSDIPESMLGRWVSPDETFRLQVFPNADIGDNALLRQFVTEVRSVAPEATAGPVMTFESGKAIVGSFEQAFISAVVLILLLLVMIFRTWLDPLLVLVPLLVAGLLTGAATVLIGFPLNFANVIALPLLLGLGVDNGVHIVHRLRDKSVDSEGLLRTSTARGIVFSSLTTICSFGSLAFMSHRGTASMGQLLTIGVLLTLVATLAILPAFIAPWMRRSV